MRLRIVLCFWCVVGASAAYGSDSLAAFAKSCQSAGTAEATYQAHTKGSAPSEESSEFKAWIANPAHWTAERNAAHQSLENAYLERVRLLSDSLSGTPLAQDLDKPVLLLTRGNSGSGKSYMLKNPDHPLLEQLALPRLMKDPRFAEAPINPDVLKHEIQAGLERGKVSNGAVHEEGSMLADRIIERAFSEGLSFIVDKRFGRAAQVDKLARRAQEKGYHVIVVDVDAPLNVSSSRVTDRPVGGESPNVQFEPIRSGYVEARENRAEVAALSSVNDYLAFSSNPHDPAANGLVASRSGSGKVVAAKPEAWKRLTEVQGSEVTYAEHLYRDLLDLLARTYPTEFASVLGRKGDALPEATGWNMPPHSYLVLEGDRAILKKVAEGEYASPKPGDEFSFKIGAFSRRARYRVVSVDDAIVFENVETGRRKSLGYERFLKTPREAHISEEALQDYANTRGGSALVRLRDDRYDLVKTQTSRDHEKMAYAIHDYLTRTIPGVKVRMEPEGDRVRLYIENTDGETKARLVQDRNWSVKLVAGSSPESPALLIDTKDIERQNYPMLSPRPDRGIGYNGVGRHTPGSAGHEFVTYGSQLDLLADVAGQPGRRLFPDAPPLFQVARGRVGFAFSSWAENGKYFHGGFRSDQGLAFHHSARIHLHSAKKAMLKADKDASARLEAIAEAKAALHGSRMADEFLGYTAYGLEQVDATQPGKPINPLRPTSMNRQWDGPLTVQFHQGQMDYRRSQSGRTVEAEVAQAKLWFEAKLSANRLMAEEATKVLTDLGAEKEITRLNAEWQSAQSYPDASALER